jgi:hypothetical protein
LSGSRHHIAKPVGPPTDYGSYQVPPTVTDRTTTSQTQTLTVTGATGPVNFAFGHQLMAGQILYFYYNAAQPLDFWYVIGLGWGEFDSLLATTINDVNTNTMGNIAIWWHAGTATQTFDTHLAAVDTSWDENLVVNGRGISHAVVHLQNIGTAWTQLPNILFEMKTRKCLDANTGTTAYTENTILQMYEWMRDPEGRNLPVSRINTPSIIAGEAIGFQAVGTHTRYESHVLMSDSTTCSDWQKTFLLLCDGQMPFTQNQYYLVIDRPGSPVAAYTDAHFAHDPPPEGYRDDPTQKVNQVAIVWTDIANKWQAATEKFPLDATLIAQGVDPITVTYQLPWIHDLGLTQARCKYLYYDSFYDFRLQLQHLASTSDRSVGDLITQSVAARGIAAQQFRLVSRTKNANNTFDDVLLEYNAARYSDDVSAPYSKIASTLPDPNAAPAGVTGLAAPEQLFLDGISYRSRLAVTWTPSAGVWAGSTIISYTRNGAAAISLGAFAGGGPVYIDSSALGTFVVTAKVQNTLNQAVLSAPATVTTVAVGKTTMPNDVLQLFASIDGQRVILHWQPASDPDVSTWELRRGAVTDTWATATYVAQVGGLTYADTPAFSATLRYFVKAIDSAFPPHYSVNAATRDVQLLDLGATAVETADSADLTTANPANTHSTLNSSAHSHFGPNQFGVWYGSGQLIAEVSMPADDALYGPFQKFMLTRTFTPAAAEAERVAGGYASVGAWATAVDDPRRGGAPLWAPLPANASGEILGAIGSAIRRLADHRARFISIEHSGIDTPGNVSVALPVWAIGASFGGVVTKKFYGFAHMLPPDTGHTVEYFGVSLSTNSPFYQQIVKSDTFGNYLVVSSSLKIYSFLKSGATTDASGLFTVSYAAYADAQLGFRPSGSSWLTIANAVASSASGKGVQVDNVDFTNATVRFKTYVLSTGAAAPSVGFTYELIDNGDIVGSNYWA